MNTLPHWTCVLLFSAALALPGAAFSQVGSVLRAGPVNGQPSASQGSPLPLPSVNANSATGVLEFFDNGLSRFQEEEVVSGGANNGLGPRFNLNSCSGCHAYPAVGGSSPPNNPEFAMITSRRGSIPLCPVFASLSGNQQQQVLNFLRSL